MYVRVNLLKNIPLNAAFKKLMEFSPENTLTRQYLVTNSKTFFIKKNITKRILYSLMILAKFRIF